jgi:hypothetical protein
MVAEGVIQPNLAHPLPHAVLAPREFCSAPNGVESNAPSTVPGDTSTGRRAIRDHAFVSVSRIRPSR